MVDINRLLGPYNPWLEAAADAFGTLPAFRREIYHELLSDFEHLPQIVSVTGPRRVGKTTLLHQLIQNLIKQGVDPKRIVYYSLDDPALLLNSESGTIGFIEQAMQLVQHAKQTLYFFLDEIQRLEGWELYLKKYYDLKYPVRFVISGSASSPIFKKSRESLLGRIKDHHQLPFSFREFALFNLRADNRLLPELEALGAVAATVIEQITNPRSIANAITIPSDPLKLRLDELLNVYLHEGGFPEVWELPSLVAKQDYLFDNQVRKVIDEDLVLAVDLRKPELLKQFYIALLATPGIEKNIAAISRETGIQAQQIEKYLPLLEMTDLVFHVSKFRSGSLSIRRGNMKFYLSDLGLRNAVLRISLDELLNDADALGKYAENLVFLALKKWRGALQIDYFRDRAQEVDFIVHVGAQQYLPIEVKYQNSISDSDTYLLNKFRHAYPKSHLPILVTKSWDDYGMKNGVFAWPLPLFLIMFG
jgi:predicted AAA+ superfamily ATPase